MSGHRDSHVATIQALMIPSAFFLSTRSHHWALESWLNAHVQFGVVWDFGGWFFRFCLKSTPTVDSIADGVRTGEAPCGGLPRLKDWCSVG